MEDDAHFATTVVDFDHWDGTKVDEQADSVVGLRCDVGGECSAQGVDPVRVVYLETSGDSDGPVVIC